ncbi:hypothetical protein [Duganella sp. CY15W]|uniref:hypothetical protein n=1 Tax=Duganella sp. CY15W TaxID=2692172 RepID=UPI001371F9F4|nr:hypothetical protein [Duganella sp. CY15W]
MLKTQQNINSPATARQQQILLFFILREGFNSIYAAAQHIKWENGRIFLNFGAF